MLEVIRKGKKRYTDYLPYQHFSFLNPKQLVGNNPYVIEQEVKDTFEAYQTQFATIKPLITQFHEAYFEVRKQELSTQIKKIHLLCADIESLFSQIPKHFTAISQQYKELRQHEWQQQLTKIEPLIANISEMFEKYAQEPRFLDKMILNSNTFKRFDCSILIS